MKRTLILAIGISAFSTAALAQGKSDHLLCYQARDPLQVKSVLDAIAEQQPEFTRRRCRITQPIEFCAPVTKVNVDPQHPEARPGQPLQDDYICYAVQCPRSAPPPKRIVADQFGTRPQVYGAPTRFCAPARKQPETQSCSMNAAGQCGGTCPSATQRCLPVPGTRQCGCVTP